MWVRLRARGVGEGERGVQACWLHLAQMEGAEACGYAGAQVSRLRVGEEGEQLNLPPLQLHPLLREELLKHMLVDETQTVGAVDPARGCEQHDVGGVRARVRVGVR